MKNKKLDVIIIGTGGLAREFTSYFSSSCNILGYSTTCPYEFEKFNLNGHLFSLDITKENLPTKNLVIAIGSPRIKKKLYDHLSKFKFTFPSIIHETALVSKSSFLGDGVIISPMAIIGPNTRIGNLVYCNYQTGVGHDSIIGDYTQINPGAQIGGEVIVHPESLIGSNSTILQKTRLNNTITVGSGSVVLGTKNKSGTIAPIYSKYLPF